MEAALDPAVLGLLALAALLTSMLSAIVGMAGGITLLAAMLLVFPPLIAIPVHGVVQLVSNSSRAIIQRRHLEWRIIARYGVLLLPAGYLGLELARSLPPEATRAAIGVFVLLATWAPKLLLLGSHPEDSNPSTRFFALGGVVGFLNSTLGATGPLIAPFFLNLGLTRFQLVGTKAACQMLGHLAKILLFGITGFVYADYLPVLALLCAMVVAGTWLGSRLLHRVSERAFVWLYRGVLTGIAVQLIARELWALAG